MGFKGKFKTKSNTAFKELRKSSKAWSNGKMIRGVKQIDSLNYSLHYASPCVWEGIRSYEQRDGSTKIFKLEEHVTRLFDSAKIMGFEIGMSYNEVLQGCRDVVSANGGGDLYLRPVAYSSGDAESAKPQDQGVSVDIYAFPLKTLHGEKSIDCIISSFARSYPHYQMQAKTAENYSFLQKVKPELKASGANEALIMDNLGYIVEATVANLFVVKGDVIMTPPNNGSILPGITRKTVVQILSDPNIMFVKYKKAPVIVEKNITRADLYTADCVFLTGTYAEIVDVARIDGREIGNKDSKSYYKILRGEYTRLTRNYGE